MWIIITQNIEKIWKIKNNIINNKIKVKKHCFLWKNSKQFFIKMQLRRIHKNKMQNKLK